MAKDSKRARAQNLFPGPLIEETNTSVVLNEETETCSPPLTLLEPETQLSVNHAKIYLLKEEIETPLEPGTILVSKNALTLKDAEINSLKKEIKKFKSEVTEKENKLLQKDSGINLLQREIQKLKSEVTEKQNKLLQKDSEINLLKMKIKSSSKPDTSSQPNTVLVSKNALTVKDAEIYLLQKEVETLKAEVNRGQNSLTFDAIKKNTGLLHRYTGLPSEEAFIYVADLIKKSKINYYAKSKVLKISVEEQLLCTLMKLRLALPHFDLAYRFGVSESSIMNIVITYLCLLHDILVVDSTMEKISFNPGNCKKSFRIIDTIEPNLKEYSTKIDDVCGALVNLSKCFSLNNGYNEVSDGTSD